MPTDTLVTKHITLFLMTEKGYQVLRYIIEHLDQSIVAEVVGARDKALVNDYFTEIQVLCKQENIPFRSRLESGSPIGSPYALAISWRWLIQDAGTIIVLHDSLLPRYRGFAPLVNCLINGEPEIGVTALFANAEFDRGDILTAASRPIQYPITIAQAIARSVECYIDIVARLWESLSKGKELSGTPQYEEAATYSLWRDEEDYQIDWQRDNYCLHRFINALGWPYKGATTNLNGLPVRILSAEIEPDVIIENRQAGKVLFMNNQQPVVVCGKGLLRLSNIVNEAGESMLPLKQFRSRFR